MQYLRIDTWTGGYMVLDMNRYFPTTKAKLSALHKNILSGCKHEREVLESILSHLEDRQEELERYFAKYDNPDQELKGSRTYQMICKNIDQMTNYLERCQR